MWSILPDANIVIDNAAILLNDDMRRFINFEFSNQYMLFLRNCDGLNVSDKSFKELKLKNNKITLAEEVRWNGGNRTGQRQFGLAWYGLL